MATLMCAGAAFIHVLIQKYLVSAYSDECCENSREESSYSVSLMEIITLNQKYMNRPWPGSSAD